MNSNRAKNSLTVFSIAVAALLFISAQQAKAQSGERNILYHAITQVNYQLANNGSTRFSLIGLDHQGFKITITGTLTEGIADNCTKLAAQALQDRVVTKEISGRERAAKFRIYFTEPTSYFPVYRNVRVERCNLHLAGEATAGGGGEYLNGGHLNVE